MLLVLACCVCACSIQIGFTDHKAVPLVNGDLTLPASAGLYIPMPADYANGEKIAEESGVLTQKAMQETLSALPGRKIFSPAIQEAPQAVISAKADSLPYVLTMQITDWKDPPASLQYAADRAEVLLSVLDAQTGAILRSDNIECNGAATTVNAIGAYGPEDCLKPAFKKWAEGFFTQQQ